MRELTVRIKFTRPSLGNVPIRDSSGRFAMPRSPSGQVTFLATWHSANMRYAAQVLGRHQDTVGKIRWDIAVDSTTPRDRWYQRYYPTTSKKRRYALHEAFLIGHIVGINCVVPGVISHDDFWQLMSLAGRYRGLSPFRPAEYGLFTVESIRPRRNEPPIDSESAPDAIAVAPGELTGNVD